MIDNSVVRVKLDRTFIDEQGTRWIIDYKTSEIGGENSAAFIDAQVEKFRPDLDRYRTVMACLEHRESNQNRALFSAASSMARSLLSAGRPSDGDLNETKIPGFA